MVVNLPPQYYEKEAELKKAKTPEERAEMLKKFAAEYREKFANPYVAASRGI